MREDRNCWATREGTIVFWIQVSSGADSVPNFWPARYSTFAAGGRRATCAASARSQDTAVTPQASSSALAAGRLKRDTP